MQKSRMKSLKISAAMLVNADGTSKENPLELIPTELSRITTCTQVQGTRGIRHSRIGGDFRSPGNPVTCKGPDLSEVFLTPFAQDRNTDIHLSLPSGGTSPCVTWREKRTKQRTKVPTAKTREDRFFFF